MALAQHVIVQVVLANTNGLPEDSVTNTFHVRRPTGSTFDAWCAANLATFAAFYNTTNAPATSTVASYINDQISRAVDACLIKAYDGSLDPPLVPQVLSWQLGAVTGAVSMPNEVALCGSMRAAPLSGFDNANRRGRIYVGPLNTNALAASESGGDSRPLANLQNAVVYGLKRLADDLETANTDLVVYSPTLNEMTTVTQFWCDNAFDVQRRRGAKPSARVWAYKAP